MAFNLQTFKTRALTAIIFVVVMLAGLFTNAWTFLLLFSVIHFGCWDEYQKLVRLIDKDYSDISPLHKYGVMLAGYGFMLWMSNGKTYHLGGFTLHEIGWWVFLVCMIILPVIEILFSRKSMLKNLGYSLLGLLYISLSWGLLLSMYNFEKITAVSGGLSFTFTIHGVILPVFIIACMWINDTMAYIVGSFIGKTPFSKISPKKTWEGTIGGAILCVFVVGFFMGRYTSFIPSYQWYILASIAAITGTAGDLLESKIKRMAGVKDSGSLMPGHGGFLDRFDSLLLATPFIWLYLQLFL